MMRKIPVWLLVLLLSACAGNYYKEPELGPVDVITVKGLDPYVKIMKVDGNDVKMSLFKGEPNSIHLLPGIHEIFAAYELNHIRLLASDTSWMTIEGKAGEKYFIRHQFYGKHAEKLFFWLVDSNLNAIYKKDDLTANIDDTVNKYAESLYQLPDKYVTDFFISLVRQKAFAYPWSANNSMILLSFGSLNKKSHFNCNDFYLKLNEKEKEMINDLMKIHPFICRSPKYTETDVYNSFKELLSQDINTNEAADAHWAWYSATGKRTILKEILDNYLNNKEACIDCIKWSYQSIAERNPDVNNYLLEYMKDKSPEDRSRLDKLLPKKR